MTIMYLFKENFIQGSRKRRITRIGTHVFSLGRMIFARREFHVRMVFSRHALKSSSEINTHQKPFDVIDRNTLFRAVGDVIPLTNRMTRTAV